MNNDEQNVVIAELKMLHELFFSTSWISQDNYTLLKERGELLIRM